MDACIPGAALASEDDVPVPAVLRAVAAGDVPWLLSIVASHGPEFVCAARDLSRNYALHVTTGMGAPRVALSCYGRRFMPVERTCN